MTWHEVERAQLAEALRAVPPDAPTLCEGWQARHLAAHVVLREHSPVVGAGIAVPALAARAEAAIERLADDASTEGAYRDLVTRVAAPPPRWHPMSWAGELANVVEFFVHTEDVRRGAGPTPARDLDPALVEVLWKHLGGAGGARLHRLPVGVVLVRDDGPRRQVRRPKDGYGTVVVRGAVGELVLFAFGRGAAADVTVQGDPQDVEILTDRLPV
ncbi:TIGR03085 family metal-binding protein [Cellulomonas fimi]|uniref:TIGR03085 family metal-binding protein n=1 Tax=Cellulomonas fimi TaxID=1708 RepID=UPI00234C4FF0|nr:TIGR03085 family metal-binding protein [Cellulomonas fimi]MDC7122398.1 TIGR03085 family metal-binding protein [Cellulomonas fimi]